MTRPPEARSPFDAGRRGPVPAPRGPRRPSAAPPRTGGGAGLRLFGGAALVVVLVAAGCAEGGPKPTTAAVVIPRTGRAVEPEGTEARTPTGEPAPSEPEIRDRLTEVRRLVREQDYDQALAALDALRRFRLPDNLGREADALRVEVKQHLLQSMYVDALVFQDKGRVALGDPITGELLVVNLAREPLTIPARSRGGGKGSVSATTVHVDVRYREYGVDGTVMNERVTWNLEVGKDIVLQPLERCSWPLNLDTLQFGPGTLNYRTYTVNATLYPAEIRIGSETYPGNLHFRPQTCAVFPRNYEHLEAQPLARLEESVAKQSPPHVVLSAALAGGPDREAAIRRLIEALGHPGGSPPDGPTRVACCVALQVLTGEDLPAEPAPWLAWAATARAPAK